MFWFKTENSSKIAQKKGDYKKKWRKVVCKGRLGLGERCF